MSAHTYRAARFDAASTGVRRFAASTGSLASSQTANDGLDSGLRYSGGIGDLGHGVASGATHLADRFVTFLACHFKRPLSNPRSFSEFAEVIKGRHS